MLKLVVWLLLLPFVLAVTKEEEAENKKWEDWIASTREEFEALHKWFAEEYRVDNTVENIPEDKSEKRTSLLEGLAPMLRELVDAREARKKSHKGEGRKLDEAIRPAESAIKFMTDMTGLDSEIRKICWKAKLQDFTKIYEKLLSDWDSATTEEEKEVVRSALAKVDPKNEALTEEIVKAETIRGPFLGANQPILSKMVVLAANAKASIAGEEAKELTTKGASKEQIFGEMVIAVMQHAETIKPKSSDKKEKKANLLEKLKDLKNRVDALEKEFEVKSAPAEGAGSSSAAQRKLEALSNGREAVMRTHPMLSVFLDQIQTQQKKDSLTADTQITREVHKIQTHLEKLRRQLQFGDRTEVSRLKTGLEQKIKASSSA